MEPVKDMELQTPPAVYKETEQVAVINISNEYRIVKKENRLGRAFHVKLDRLRRFQSRRDLLISVISLRRT